MNNFVLLILFLIIAPFYKGHTLQTDKQAVEKVAGHIIADTEYGFYDPGTGKVYVSATDVPDSSSVRVLSPYIEWEYVNGVMYMGMIAAGKALRDPKYKEYVSDNFAFIYKNIDHFRDQYNLGNRHVPFSQFYHFHALDNCGTMDASLIENYYDDHKAVYKKTIDRAAAYISKGQVRLKDGTLARNDPYKMTVWGDDLYMSVSFLARMGHLTGDMKYFDDAAHQVIKFHHYLYDKNEHIYFHAWFADENAHSVAHWGRANGWIMMAQVALLNYLPHDYSKRDTLIAILKQQIRGIIKYQSESGLWHQLLDKKDSYFETSCTAMFVYSIAKAVNEGWIDARYYSAALQGWKGLLSKETPDGQIKDVCIGTGVGNDLNFYYTRPKRLNNSHVLGPFLLAGSEIIKHDENK